MTTTKKNELRRLVKAGYTFQEIRDLVECSDSTIRQYLKVFAPTKETPNE